MSRWHPLSCLIAAWGLSACWSHAELPADAPAPAQLGRCGAKVSSEQLCAGDWSTAVASCQGDAEVHASFPELVPQACFVPVHYREGRLPRAEPVPAGCGYCPSQQRSRLAQQAERYERVARKDGAPLPLPLPIACDLPDEVRRAAAQHNAASLRALAQRKDDACYPYAAVATFGFGYPSMASSSLVPWRPADACLTLDKREMDKLSINRIRAGRAAAGYHGGIAPLISVSGGAVHAPLYEAFMLAHLASCRFGVPKTAILLDPCADHTHTNVRNTGALLIEIGGRTGYIVTDSGLQAHYLQEWTGFSIIGGSIDQRSLRDFGYLLGSWRQASVGMDAGFWFSPYRFFADPEQALRNTSCAH